MMLISIGRYALIAASPLAVNGLILPPAQILLCAALVEPTTPAPIFLIISPTSTTSILYAIERYAMAAAAFLHIVSIPPFAPARTCVPNAGIHHTLVIAFNTTRVRHTLLMTTSIGMNALIAAKK